MRWFAVSIEERVRETYFAIGCICITLALIGADLFLEAQEEGLHTGSVLLEAGIASFSFVGVMVLLYRLVKERTAHSELKKELQKNSSDLAEWKHRIDSISKGIAEAIDQQLNQWSLSPSEKDVAMLLIKGLGIREIAELRKVKDKTIRTQASSIYKKSNLANRSELAAFFLDDLLG